MEVVSYVRRNIEYLLSHEAGADSSEASLPRKTGREHALRGIPLSDVLAAYRMGFAQLWDAITEAMLAGEGVDPAEVIDAASELWWRADHFGHAVTEGHRDATTEILLRQQHEHSAMVESLVAGTIVGHAQLWETAGRLGFPNEGHFLVVVAEARPSSSDPLPGIITGLRKLEVVSAWRLAPHQMVGVLSLPGRDVTAAVDCLEQHASGSVGLSPMFTHLDGTPQAFYLAGVALRSRPCPDARVRLFDRTPIAVLAAASPDTARAIVADLLGPVLALPDHERAMVLETFDAWRACGGSVTEAGIRLFCHPNTVRYRLRKLAELTGRSTDDPDGISELTVAVHAWRLVGYSGEDR